MALTVSVAVMAHPARRHLVDRLVGRLDRPAMVVWDRWNDEWDTACRAWLVHDPDATHHLVLQDDALVCQDLVAGLEVALKHAPADVALSLYFGAGTPFPHQATRVAAQADADRVSWLAVGGLHWGVAVVLPTRHIPDLLRSVERARTKYDRRISGWLQDRGFATWHPWPSLVDHLDGVSLLPGHGRRPGRVAHRFVGEDRSALDVDWSGGALLVPSLRAYTSTSLACADPGRLTKEPVSMPKPAGQPHPELMTPRKTVTLRTNPGSHRLVAGETVAHRDSWIVEHKPDLWRPLLVHYPGDDDAAVASPEAPADDIDAPAMPAAPTPVDEPAAPPEQPKPAAKDVRAWAKREGIDVPARGPLPDDVVERYQAARTPTDW